MVSVLPLVMSLAAHGAVENVKAKAGYAYLRDGHIYSNGNRLKLWGVNASTRSVDVAGVKLSNQQIDIAARRIREMGFNAVRMWPSTSTNYGKGHVKGDLSAIDRHDYFFYRLKREGLHVWHHLEPIGMPVESADAEWKEAAAKALGTKHRWARVVAYVDPTFLEFRLRYIRTFLNHVNQYTGKRYAEDENIVVLEMVNEGHVVGEMLEGLKGDPPYFQKQLQGFWNDFLLEEYGTDEALGKAWGTLSSGEHLEDKSVSFKKARGRREADRMRFAYAWYRSATDRMIQTTRAQAPAGVGCNVVPILLGTNGMGHMQLHTLYSDSWGGVYASSCYRMNYTVRKDAAHYPWASLLSFPPASYQFGFGGKKRGDYGWEFGNELFRDPAMGIDFNRLDGVSFLIYETNVIRPSKFKAEHPMMMSLMAQWQDWDGVFHFTWGDTSESTHRDFGGGPLPYAKDRYWAIDLKNDEVYAASLKAAGMMFLHGCVQPAGNPTRFVFGKRALHSPEISAQQGPNEEDWMVTSRTTWRYGSRIVFDPEGDFVRKVEGPTVDEPFRETVRWGNQVHWDWKNERVVVDTPRAKAFVGFVKGPTAFADGTTLTVESPEFVCFALVSDTEQALSESKRIVIVATSYGFNTGFEMDLSKLSNRRYAFGPAIRNVGEAPVRIQRVKGVVTIPYLGRAILSSVGFDLSVRERRAERTVRLDPEDEAFYYLIERD